MTAADAEQWWKDEPERKLTGIVLPSWDDDDEPADWPTSAPPARPAAGPAHPAGPAPSYPAGPAPAHPAGPAPSFPAGSASTYPASPAPAYPVASAYQSASGYPAGPSSAGPSPARPDPLTDPLTGPLEALTGPYLGWRAETAPVDGQRMVPVVPSGPPPVWPPADFAGPVELPPLSGPPAPGGYTSAAELPAPGGYASLDELPAPGERLAPYRDDSMVGSGPVQDARSGNAPAEQGASRREFPRYIAGEFVLPGTAPVAEPQATAQPQAGLDLAAQSRTPFADAPTGSTSTWAPQPTPSTPVGTRTTPPPSQDAAPSRTLHDAMPAAPTMPSAPSAPASRDAGDARDPGDARDAGLTAPALPGVQFTAPPKRAQVNAAPAQPAPAGHPPMPGPTPTGMPQADVPPPPRPAPPSVPPHARPQTAAPRSANRSATQAADQAAHQPADQTVHQPAAQARPADAVTATQPAIPAAVPAAVPTGVPAAVHAAQQGAAGPQQGAAPVVPTRKTREGAPHPAFPDATARSMRILPIAAELLPLEITDRRRLSTVRRLVVAGVAVFALLISGWFVVAYRHTEQARAELNKVNERKVDLLRERSKYTEVDNVQKQRKAITDQLRLVMARDLSWSALLTSLQQAAPKGVTVQSVTGSLTPEEGAKSTGTVVGLITLTGTAPSKAAIASYVDTLGKVTGITNPFPTDATESDEGLTYTIRVDITTAALGGRFTSPSAAAAPSTSGGK